MKNYVKEYKGHKVPEGAEEYQEKNGDWFRGFYKESDDALFFYSCEDDNPSWRLIGCASSEVKPSHTIPLPEVTQEWNGEGLPPVGCECEVNIGATDVFEAATIMYISNQIVISDVGGHEFSSQASAACSLICIHLKSSSG